MPVTRPVTKTKETGKYREIIPLPKNNDAIPGFIYGKYDFSSNVNFKGLNISFEMNDGILHYSRDIVGHIFQANIATSKTYYYIEPVEPMNIPSHITDFLQVKFEEILVEPESTTTIYLTIPVGIGVFIESNKGEMNLLDMVGYNKPHFSLYGQPERGVITRIHTSKVYSAPPSVKNYKEAVLRVDIDNRTGEWRKIGRIVMYMKGLEFYYDSSVIVSCIEMNVTSETSAYVNCLDASFYTGLNKCKGVFKDGKIERFCNISDAVVDNVFLMDMGLR